MNFYRRVALPMYLLVVLCGSCKRSDSVSPPSPPSSPSQPSLSYSVLPVLLHGQQTDTWCWAASTQMVAEYYRASLPAPYTPPLQQWQIAENAYPPPEIHDCPQNTCSGQLNLTPDDCSGPHSPELFHFKLGSKTTEWPLSWESIRREILAGRPLLYSYCLTTKSGYVCNEEDNGHIVTIDGFLQLQVEGMGNIRFVQVKDPLPCCYGDVLYLNYERYRRGGAFDYFAGQPSVKYRRFHVKTYYCLQPASKVCEEDEPAYSSFRFDISGANIAKQTGALKEPTFASPIEAATSVLEELNKPSADARRLLASLVSGEVLKNLDLGSSTANRLRIGEPIQSSYLLSSAVDDSYSSEKTLRDSLVESGLRAVPVLAPSGQPLFLITVEQIGQKQFEIAEIGRPTSVRRFFNAIESMHGMSSYLQGRVRQIEVPGFGRTILLAQPNGEGKNSSLTSLYVVDDCSGAASGKRFNAKDLLNLKDLVMNNR